MRLPLALMILSLTACEAVAPPVKETKWIVRIAYVHDLAITPHDTEKGCEVPKRFAAKELPELDGYTKIVRCIAIGEK